MSLLILVYSLSVVHLILCLCFISTYDSGFDVFTSLFFFYPKKFTCNCSYLSHLYNNTLYYVLGYVLFFIFLSSMLQFKKKNLILDGFQYQLILKVSASRSGIIPAQCMPQTILDIFCTTFFFFFLSNFYYRNCKMVPHVRYFFTVDLLLKKFLY